MRSMQEVLAYLSTKPDLVRDSPLGRLTERTVMSPPVDGAPPLLIGEIAVPQELRELWKHTSELRVSEEPIYGQCGLVVVCPAECESLTREFREDFREDGRCDDLIVGYSKGDSELVMLTGGPSPTSTEVRIVLPLDRRAAWPIAAPSLSEFLWRFADSEDKWWPR